MKRLIFLLLLCALPAHAATWYATSSSVNINTTSLWVPTQGASCAGSGTALVWGAQANGDTFNANGCTALAINVDPGSVSAQVTLTTDGTNGGAFTLTMANLGTIGTIHANVTATKTTVVALSGTTSSGTISGNITGGSTASQNGITDTASSGTLTVIGNVTGGSASAAEGLAQSAAGPIVITGNVTAGSAVSADGIEDASATGTVTITGNCIGSNTVVAYGCYAHGTSTSLTLTGNLINGLHGPGVVGSLFFTPAATNYILSPKDASYTLSTIDTHATEMPTNPGVSNVASGTTYGSYTGTLSTTQTGFVY
jgi:hypothetical protein